MACEICIMEHRIGGIEDRLNTQSDQYTKAQVESAGRMASIERDIGMLVKGMDGIDKKLTDVLDERQADAIKNATNENKPAASKWKSLSDGTKTVIIGLILATLTLIITNVLTR